ncbi:MAG: hypothetical protein EB003_12750 [Flavobacteriia bacterium]|nr:hypothetical protein [Flavobacteriia bacterium]
MKLEWNKAPVKTQWGHDMMETCVAIDKNHTLSLYCEESQIAKVPKVLRQKWKSLTEREIEALILEGDTYWWNAEDYIRNVLAKLKEKNNG